MSDLDEAARSAEDDAQAGAAGESGQDAALQDLRRRHQLIASELARLSAILESAGAIEDGQQEREWSSAPAPRYETAPMPTSEWERAHTGGVVRSAGVRPENQRVIHLGTQRTAVERKRRSLAVGLSAGAVGAVVAAALILLVMSPRATDAGFAETVAGPASEAPAVASPAPQAAAVPAATQEATAPAPVVTSSAALDAILMRARSVPDLNEETTGLIRRLPALSGLSGSARAEEAADIYGVAVTAARADTSGIAGEIATALEPEVTMDSVLALADRRPDVVGTGVEPLMQELAMLPTLPPETQQAHAQDLMDAVAAGVAAETIAGPFCNSIAKALSMYGAKPPA